MLYFSTRNSKEKVTASQAISRGLAPDGAQSLKIRQGKASLSSGQGGLPRKSPRNNEAFP